MSADITIYDVVSVAITKSSFSEDERSGAFDSLKLTITDSNGNVTAVSLFTEPDVFPEPEKEDDDNN